MGRCLIIFGYDLRSSRGSYGEELIIGLSGTEYRLHSKIRSRKNCREKSASRKFVGRARKISCSFGVAHHGTFLMHFFLHEIFDLMLFAKLVSSLPEMIFPRRAEYRCDGKGKKRLAIRVTIRTRIALTLLPGGVIRHRYSESSIYRQAGLIYIITRWNNWYGACFVLYWAHASNVVFVISEWESIYRIILSDHVWRFLRARKKKLDAAVPQFGIMITCSTCIVNTTPFDL
jgi:hypothetical protein